MKIISGIIVCISAMPEKPITGNLRNMNPEYFFVCRRGKNEVGINNSE